MSERLTLTARAALLIAVALTSACNSPSTQQDQSYRLSTETGGVSSVAIGRDGTAYWTWFDTDNGSTNVYLSSLKPGDDGPSAAVRVNKLDGDSNMHGQAPAQVAIGPSGEIYVAWTNRIDVPGRRFPASDLLLARSNDGGRTFSEALIVNDDAGGPPTGHTFHDLAVGPSGEVYVSWIDTRAMDAARAEMADDTARAEGADHMHGHEHAQVGTMPGPEIRVARSLDGGTSFEKGVVVDRTSCPCCRTSLAVGADGLVYVAWRKVYDGEIRDMAVARSEDQGLTFSTPKRIHNDDWQFTGCPHTGPDLALGPDGLLHAGWYTGAENESGLYYAVERKEGFSEPVLLAGDAPVSQVRLASDPSGGIWIAWEDKRAGTVKLAHASDGVLEAPRFEYPGSEPALAVGNGRGSLSLRTESGVVAHLMTF